MSHGDNAQLREIRLATPHKNDFDAPSDDDLPAEARDENASEVRYPPEQDQQDVTTPRPDAGPGSAAIPYVYSESFMPETWALTPPAVLI